MLGYKRCRAVGARRQCRGRSSKGCWDTKRQRELADDVEGGATGDGGARARLTVEARGQ
jgi:hypothetical protein